MQQNDLPKIEAGDVKIFLTKDQEVSDQTLLEQYHQLLSEEELKRYKRFHFDEHKHQFLVSRALLRSVLGEYLSLEPAEIIFEQNSWGKPEIHADQNDQALRFNLSHTDGLVALAVTKTKRIGIDVEPIAREAELLKLADRYFSEAESLALKQVPEEEINHDFFSYWTLKESYIKAVGMGLAIPLDSFGFILNTDSIGFEIAEPTTENKKKWRFWQMEASADHYLALALHSEDNSNNDEEPQSEVNIESFLGVPAEHFKEVSLSLIRKS